MIIPIPDGVFFFVLFRDLSYNAAGIPDGDDVCRNVFVHHTARAYDRVVPDGDAGKDADVGADPYIVSHMDRPCYLESPAPLLTVNGVSRSGDYAVRRDEYIVPEGHRGAVQNRTVVICVEIFAY